MTKKISILLMFIIFTTGSIYTLYAEDSISDLQEQIDALEEENAAAKAKQDEAKQKLDDYEELLLDIQDQIATIKGQISTKEQEITDLNNTISDTKDQIADLEAEIPDKKDEADSSLVSIQQLTQSNAVSSLVSGEAGDYTKNMQSMYILYNSLAQPLKELIDTKKQLDQEKSNLELQLTNQELAKKELESQNIELEQQEDDYNYYIDQQNKILAEQASEVDSNTAEIEDKQNAIDFYKSQGCEGDDVYGVDCGATGVEAGTQGFIRPINSDYVSCEYLCYSGHSGIDLGGHGDHEIYPVYPGQVLSSGWSNSGYGNNVVLIHNTPDGVFFTRYAHMSQLYVSAGDTVGYNDQLGVMGDTGNADGVHLHFEVMVDYDGNGYPSHSECVNPRNYVNFPAGTYNWWYDRTSLV